MANKPICKLVGENGNIYRLIAIASKTLRRAGLPEQAKKMQEEITTCKSYDEALVKIMEYVDVE